MRVDNALSIGIYQNYSMLNQLVAGASTKFALGKSIGSAAESTSMATSAKITTEVRSINTALRNTQDASSLLNKADGAMGQIEGVLQRMNALSEQSANGGADVDRQKLDAEFNQMKRDVNDIAQQAAFHNMRILDGSLSREGAQRSAQTEGIHVEFHSRTQDAVLSQTISSAVPEEASVEAVVDLGRLQVQNAEAGEMITVNFGDTAIGASLKRGTNTAADIARSILDAEKVTYEGNMAISRHNVSMEVENTIQLRLAFSGVDSNTQTAQETVAPLQNVEVSVAYTAANGVDPGQGVMQYAQDISFTSTAPGVQYSSAPIKVNRAVFKSPLKVGDTFHVSGKLFELVVPGGAAKTQGASTISLFAAQTNQDVVKAMKDAMALQLENHFTLKAEGNEIQIEQKSPESGDVNISMQPAQHNSTTVEFDMNRLQTGDQLELQITDQKGQAVANSYLHIRGNSAADMAGILTRGTNGVLSGDNALTFEDSQVLVKFEPMQSNRGRELLVQTGTQENEQLNIGIQATNTAALGLDNVGIATQETARAATSTMQNALEVVSNRSATLNEMQSKLGNRLSMLQQAAIGTTEAQNTIRDVEIATEKTKNTLQGITKQANTAMQAQANSKSHNVLSLLM